MRGGTGRSIALVVSKCNMCFFLWQRGLRVLNSLQPEARERQQVNVLRRIYGS